LIIYLAAIGNMRPASILPGRDRARDPRAQRGAIWLPREAGVRLRGGGDEHLAPAEARLRWNSMFKALDRFPPKEK
jgi:hypothetical protein